MKERLALKLSSAYLRRGWRRLSCKPALRRFPVRCFQIRAEPSVDVPVQIDTGENPHTASPVSQHTQRMIQVQQLPASTSDRAEPERDQADCFPVVIAAS